MEIYMKQRADRIIHRVTAIEQKQKEAGKRYIGEQVQVIYGKQGSGKSRFVKSVFGIFPAAHMLTPDPTRVKVYSYLDVAIDYKERSPGNHPILLENYDCSDAKFNLLLRFIAAAGIKIFITLQNDLPDFEKIPETWEVIETGYPKFDHKIHYKNGKSTIKYLNASPAANV